MLKLIDDKTETIVFKSSRNVKTIAGENIQIGYTAVEITSKVKDLRVNICVISSETRSTVGRVCYSYLSTEQNNENSLFPG